MTDDNKGFSQPALIFIVVILALVAGGYYMAQNKTSVVDTTDSVTVAKTSNLEVNRLFPKKILNSSIKPIGGKFVKASNEPYYVAPWRNVSTIGIDGSPLKKVPVSEGYVAYYGQSIEKTVIVRAAKLTFSEDKENLRKLLGAAFPSSSSVPLYQDDKIMTWGTYSDEAAKDEISGDARIFFEDSLRYVQIQVSGGFTKEEFANIVKSYIDALQSSSTSVVSSEDILNETEFLRLQNK